VDITALEQRDEVPIPVVADLAPSEPVRWDPLAEPDDALRPDAPRGPMARVRPGDRTPDGDAAPAGGRRSLGFLRAGRKAAED
jgi:hypothetical protein